MTETRFWYREPKPRFNFGIIIFFPKLVSSQVDFDPPLDNNSNFLIFFFLGQSNACGVGVGPLAGLAPTIAQLQLQQQPLHSVSFFFNFLSDFLINLILVCIWQIKNKLHIIIDHLNSDVNYRFRVFFKIR